MKVSKVDKIRVAVGRKNAADGTRGMLYKMAGKTGATSVEEIVSGRVQNANRLYSVFFRADYPKQLDGHWNAIVKQVQKNNGGAKEVLRNYKKYEEASFDGRVKSNYIDKMNYKPAGKDIAQVLRLYVSEKLAVHWHKKEYLEAAVEVLKCICNGREYAKAVANLPAATVAQFEAGCLEGRNRVFAKNTADLERMFTALMRMTAERCNTELYTGAAALEQQEADIEKQLAFLAGVREISFGENKKTGELDIRRMDEFSYADACYTRMEAMVVRMRRGLKRGELRETAIQLLLALSQANGKTWSQEIGQMLEDEASAKRLRKFILEVNKDFHHFNVIKSVKNTDVAVRPQENGGLLLSNAGKEKKQGMQDTLLSYAASKEASDAVLLRMKSLLFSYFLGNMEEGENRRIKEAYLTVEALWKFRGIGAGLFDAEFVSEEEEGNRKADTPLAFYLEDADGRRHQKRMAERMNYVNYGYYLRLKKNCTDTFAYYWCEYIKDFIEENYVTKVKAARGKNGRQLTEENCNTEAMLSKCWHAMIRHMCGKYMDIGKAVYHFMLSGGPEAGTEWCLDRLQEDFAKGITSFDYESIKAEENLQKAMFGVLISGVSNFSRSVADYSGEAARTLAAELFAESNGIKELNEDVLMIEKAQLAAILHKDAKQKLLRYFGGYSACEGLAGLETEKLVWEFREILRGLRNTAFHYTDGKKAEIKFDATRLLWKQDVQANKQLVLDKYYSNNVCRYYNAGKIKELIQRLYREYKEQEAQIPAFRTIWKRKDFSAYVNRVKTIPANIKNEVKERTVFEGALYFLLKEIYYQEFITGAQAAGSFFRAVEQYCLASNARDKRDPHAKPAQNFWNYVKELKTLYEEKKLTFGAVCQTIMTEYNQQNAKNSETDGEIYQHFKILFPLCMQKGFEQYIREHYAYLLEPYVMAETDENVLQDAEITCFDDLLREANSEEYSWYVLAHFIHPKQLNHFVGSLKDYMQFKQDIFRRCRFANTYQKEELNRMQAKLAKKEAELSEILRVMEFVRSITGRISHTFSDYYENEEAYAAYLKKYIDFPKKEGLSVFESFRDFCVNTLPGGEVMDVYMDEKNPRLLKNVELARMYAGGDAALHARNKVTAEELQKYYQEEAGVRAILQKGLCDTKDEQTRVVDQQNLRGRITLNDVTGIQEIINDMLSQLVTFSYFRERDEMYLLLGFYYMALQTNRGEGWQEEGMDAYSGKKLTAKKGFVLYQVLSVFTYGLKLYSGASTDGVGGQLSSKIVAFDAVHSTSLAYALRLFMDDARNERAIREARNYVDHFKYYARADRSILELYSTYYNCFFDYSTKLRKSVLLNFESILERYFVGADLALLGRERDCQLSLKGSLRCEKFTYKLAAGKDTGKTEKTVELPAKSEEFLESLKAELEFKE